MENIQPIVNDRHSIPYHENAEKYDYLSREEKIIQSMDDDDIEALKRLQVDNLFKRSKIILGVRSEDLLFFAQCVKKGYFPTAKSHLMGKIAENGLYLTENPERWHTEENPFGTTFKDQVFTNLSLYSKIAKKQAVNRNIIERLNDDQKKSFFEELKRFVVSYDFTAHELYENDPENMEAGSAAEAFYGFLFEESIRGFTGFKEEKREARKILNKYLATIPNSGIYDLNAFLDSLENRGGIIIGFNENVGKDFKLLDEYMEDSCIYDIPGGKLPLKYIVGFEALGEFEDRVLERWGISE